MTTGNPTGNPPPAVNIPQFDILVQKADQGEFNAIDQLSKFRDRRISQVLPDIWYIAYNSQHPSTLFWIFSLLHQVISRGWDAIPINFQVQTQRSLTNLIQSYLSNTNFSSPNIATKILYKMDQCLVEIAKRQGPDAWNNFLTAYLMQALNQKVPESVLHNTVYILHELALETFNFAKFTLISSKASKLKKSFDQNMSSVFSLFDKIIPKKNQNRPEYSDDLIAQSLEVLSTFIPHIPTNVIFASSLIHDLCHCFTKGNKFATLVLKCFTEISKLELYTPGHTQNDFRLKMVDFIHYFHFLLQKFVPIQTIDPDPSSTVAPQYPRKDVASALVSFLSTFLKYQWRILEGSPMTFVPGRALSGFHSIGPSIYQQNGPPPITNTNLLVSFHRYLGSFINLNLPLTDSIMRDILDYWSFFTNRLQMELSSSDAFLITSTRSTLDMILAQVRGPSLKPLPPPTRDFPRRNLYSFAVSKILKVYLCRMPAPPAFVETGYDIATGQFVTSGAALQTDQVQLAIFHQISKSTRNLVSTHTKMALEVIAGRIEALLGKTAVVTPQSIRSIHSLIWTISCLSGLKKKDILYSTVAHLLSLILAKLRDLPQGAPEPRRHLISDLLYVLARYTVALQSSITLFCVLLFRVLEFMSHDAPCVSNLALDAFLEVSKSCGNLFTHSFDEMTKTHNVSSNIVNLFSRLLGNNFNVKNTILEGVLRMNFPRLVDKTREPIYYRALGFMVASTSRRKDHPSYVTRYINLVLPKWTSLVNAANSVDLLIGSDPTYRRELKQALIMFSNASEALETSFSSVPQIFTQTTTIYNDLTKTHLPKAIMDKNNAQFSALDEIRNEILSLWENFARYSAPSTQQVFTQFIEPLVLNLLATFSPEHNNTPAGIITCISAVIESFSQKLAETTYGSSGNSLFTSIIVGICIPTYSVLDPTLPANEGELTEQQKISRGFMKYSSLPEHRVAFFDLLESIVKNAFDWCLTLSPPKFSRLVSFLCFGIRHPQHNISSVPLRTCDILCSNAFSLNNSKYVDFKKFFFRDPFLAIITQLIAVITDKVHKSQFTAHIELLHLYLGIVSSGALGTNLDLFPTPPPDSELASVSKDLPNKNCAHLSYYIAKKISQQFPAAHRETIQSMTDEMILSSSIGKFYKLKRIATDITILL